MQFCAIIAPNTGTGKADALQIFWQEQMEDIFLVGLLSKLKAMTEHTREWVGIYKLNIYVQLYILKIHWLKYVFWGIKNFIPESRASLSIFLHIWD